jgi:hypothetical protein
MGKDLDGGDTCKTHEGVGELLNEGVGDSIEDKLFDVSFYNSASANFELFQVVFVGAICLGNFMLGATGVGMDAGVGGKDGYGCCIEGRQQQGRDGHQRGCKSIGHFQRLGI